jgi:hypothetical protein
MQTLLIFRLAVQLFITRKEEKGQLLIIETTINTWGQLLIIVIFFSTKKTTFFKVAVSLYRVFFYFLIPKIIHEVIEHNTK